MKNNQSKFIRRNIFRRLQQEPDFDGIVTAEIDGNYFAAADIALPDSDNNCQVYRLIIIKHGQ